MCCHVRLFSQVQLRKEHETIILRVDDEAAVSDGIAARLDVIAPLYVGGLPRVFTPRQGTVVSWPLNSLIINLPN